MIKDERHIGLGERVSAELRLVEETMTSLGVTFESITEAIDAGSAVEIAREEFMAVTDGEWELIKAALPEEAHQANTMDNRTFLNAVLMAVNRGGRWSDFRKKGPYPDAVRRRFGRWAHLGVWQRLAADINDNYIGSDRKAALQSAAEWAEQLRKKSAS